MGTEIFQKPVCGDLDEKERKDAALLLVHDPGGSGTIYQAAAVLFHKGSYHNTNTVFLGDRIKPQALCIENGLILVKHLEHRSDLPMAAPPSVANIVYLEI